MFGLMRGGKFAPEHIVDINFNYILVYLAFCELIRQKCVYNNSAASLTHTHPL